MFSQYIQFQLDKARATAASADVDADTRTRAERRMQVWESVKAGIASGALAAGSRTPLAGMPAWVTPQVMRGGFAQGAAGGELSAGERLIAMKHGLPCTHAAVFAWLTGEAGQTELNARLDARDYGAQIPEETALLAFAWLTRAGKAGAAGLADSADSADELLAALAPFAGRIGFAPHHPLRRGAAPAAGTVSLCTAQAVRDALAVKREPAQLAAQREALTVWLPMADRFCALWRETRAAGESADAAPAADWAARAQALLEDYDAARAVHPLCVKRHHRKQNLGRLVAATRARLAGRLDGKTRFEAESSAAAMVAKRGAPGSATLTALRARQQAVGARPSHAQLARLAARRLKDASPEYGLENPGEYAFPVTAQEADAEPDMRFAPGMPLPASVGRALDRARMGTVDELMREGRIASPEVLGRLAPRILSDAIEAAFADPAAGYLMGVAYRAFRTRRSLLLLNLAKQVQFEELPWVKAVFEAGQKTGGGALGAIRRLCGCALTAFPGEILPNTLIREMQWGAKEAGCELPWVEELAADIFMGRFSGKFLEAARLAVRQLEGSAYARYYDLNAAEIETLAPEGSAENALGEWCARRARVARDRRGRVAENGAVIEQAQIVTTHNLAALIELGVRISASWDELAAAAARYGARYANRASALIEQARTEEQGHFRQLALRAAKKAAYAWRQALFFASQPGADPARLASAARAGLPEMDENAACRWTPVVAGLEDVLRGQAFDADGRTANGRRLLGWALPDSQHDLLAD